MEPQYDPEQRAALEELGYDILNRVPLLGTLVRTFIRLHATEQRRRFRDFALKLLEGVDEDEELLRQIEGQEAEAFNTVLKAMLSDMESKKTETYAFAYLFIVREKLLEVNPPMADYLLLTIKNLSPYDIELIKEIPRMWNQKCSNDICSRYFKSLEFLEGNNKYFDWHRRLSVQNLIHHGLLTKIHPERPIWSTEQFDIVSSCVHGLDLSKNSLIKRRIADSPKESMRVG